MPELTVSVVIPYFEAETELRRTLAGLTRQTYPAGLLEVIVVGKVLPPSLESSIFTFMTPLDVHEIVCVLPAHQLSPPFGAVRLTVPASCSFVTNTSV